MSRSKCDPTMGKELNQYLKSIGQETPLIENKDSNEKKVEQIAHHFSKIMEILGLDLNDDSLMDTPKRIAHMYVDELFWGLDTDNFPQCTNIANTMDYDEMVTVKDIKVMLGTHQRSRASAAGKSLMDELASRELN